MMRMRWQLTLTYALIALAAAANGCLAEDSALVAKGKRLAEANCKICHAIYETGTSPLAVAPPFRNIAVNYDFAELEDAFNEGVATDHPAMPDWQMTPEQAEAIASYIMTLAPAGERKSELEAPSQPTVGNP